MAEYPSFSVDPPETPAYATTSSTAILSLIAGILGLSFLPLIGSIIALISGARAKEEIAQSEGMVGGFGIAQTGVILGWIGIGLLCLSLCAAGGVFLTSMCILASGLQGIEWGGLLPIVLPIL